MTYELGDRVGRRRMNLHAGPIVRLIRRAVGAVRQHLRGQITVTSRDALVRDGFSIDQVRFVDGPLAHPLASSTGRRTS